jgi:hypothetical protein
LALLQSTHPSPRSDSPTSSLGIPERSGRIAPGTAPTPPPTCHRASTPARALRPVPRSRGNHPRNPVPSSWFRTTSTVSSARRSRACCIPLPVMGFAAFRATGFPADSWTNPGAVGSADALPATIFTPLEGFPSTTAAPRRRGRCPLAVPSGSAGHLRPPPLPESAFSAWKNRSVGFEALLRHRVRNVRPIVANRETSSPSWASFPFKVLPDDEANPRLARRTGVLPPTLLAEEERSPPEAPSRHQSSTTIPKDRADREAQPTPKRWWASPRGDLCRREAVGSGFRGADDIPPSIRRLLAHRDEPDWEEPASTKSVRSRSPRCASRLRPPVTRCASRGLHRRPSWGL